MPRTCWLVLALGLVLATRAPAQLMGQDDGPADLAPTMLRPLRPVRAARRAPFVAGFNQAWLGQAYGSQWTRGFDLAEATRMLRLTRELGGFVLRMWLFEGLDPDGVVWDGVPGPGREPRRTRPTGIDPARLRNLDRFLALAEEEGVRVYLTLFTGNIFLHPEQPRFEARAAEWWNVLNDRFGVGQAWRDRVLGPVLEVLAAHPRALFGIDLMNELNALVRYDGFAGGWDGAVAFVRGWRAAIRARVRVPVGASFGHHDAVDALLAGHLPASAVDFYDFHVYDDEGRIPRAGEVAAFAAAVDRPVYLGEFGQATKVVDDRLQVAATGAFLGRARDLGLAGALAWRLSDVRPGAQPDECHSFERDGVLRPAAFTFRAFAAAAGVRP